MPRILLAAGLILASSTICSAQSWVPWNGPPSYGSPSPSVAAPQAAPKGKKAKSNAAQPRAITGGSQRSAAVPTSLGSSWFDADEDDAPRAQTPIVLEGGPRPAITPIPPKEVAYSTSHPRGTIVVDSGARRLYLIQSASTALVYPVSVGREGFTWVGTEKITRMANWPDWNPPAEMRERDPRLPTKMTGGLRNPLGAKALYLGNTLYRIHGSNDARSIGRAASSGCFRMHNGHVVDLASRVGVGTRVVVINARNTRQASAPRKPTQTAQAATMSRLGATPAVARTPSRN